MKHHTKVIFGGFMGNVVEAYDVSICYFLAHALSIHLIGDHQGQPGIVLMLVFLAYLAKPMGAFVLGLCSDLYGRKNVLMASIVIMGLSTALIGLIPTYQTIGIMAPVLLLSFRMIQSMALGSEFLNSASFLVESGANHRRGFMGCWSSVGVKTGVLLACLIALPISELDHVWAWRLPFVFAVITTGFGVYVRYVMPESKAYVMYYAQRKKPSTMAIFLQSRLFLKQHPFLFNYAFFASFLAVATGFFFYLYIPLHAIRYSELSRTFILLSTSGSLVLVSVLIPLFGWYSDRSDRLKMLGCATLSLLVLSHPFMNIVNHGSPVQFVLMQGLISIPCACYYSVSTVILTELFPLQIRCTALSIVYSLASSLAAGLPPLLANYLASVTGNPNAPALIMLTITAVVLCNALILFKKYRTDKNTYQRIESDDMPPLFKIVYTRSI